MIRRKIHPSNSSNITPVIHNYKQFRVFPITRRRRKIFRNFQEFSGVGNDIFTRKIHVELRSELGRMIDRQFWLLPTTANISRYYDLLNRRTTIRIVCVCVKNGKISTVCTFVLVVVVLVMEMIVSRKIINIPATFHSVRIPRP